VRAWRFSVSPGGRRHWRIAAWTVGVLTGLPLVLGLLLTLLLHEDSTATWLTRTVLNRVQIWPDTEVTLGYVDLRRFTTLTIRDLRVGRSAEGHHALASVDTLEARLSLLALLRRQLSADHVRAAGVAVVMRQEADSTWDLLSLFSADDGGNREQGDSDPWALDVRRAEVVDAHVRAHFLASPDSVGWIEALTLRARDISYAEQLSITLDTVHARVHPPARPMTPAHVSGAMDLQSGAVTMGLRLVSDSSDVRAHGTFRLRGAESDGVSDIDVRMSAMPLDFRDVGSVLPGMDVPGSVRLEARAWGSEELLEIDIDGRSFDGATIEGRGTLTPVAVGPLRYAFEAHVRDLSPALWMDGDAALDGLDADLVLDLAGPTLDSLDGTGSLRVTAARLGGGALRPTSADLVFEQGSASFEMSGSAPPWLSFRATGTGRPFDDRPGYDLRAELAQLEPIEGGAARFTSGFVMLELEGSGVRPDLASGRATLTVDGRLGDTAVRNGEIRATWNESRGRAELDLPIGDGRVEGDLLGDWSGEATRLDLTAFDVTRLDVAALLGESASGTLSMHGAGELVLGDGGGPAGDVEAVLETARWGGMVLDTGRVSAQLRDGAFTTRTMLVSPAGGIDIEARGRPFDEVRTWRIDALVARSLDLAGVRQGLPASDIGATLRLEGEVPADPRLSTASGLLTLSPSTIGPERVDTAEVRVALSEGRLELEGEARVMDGSVALAAEAWPLEEVPSFRLERLVFEGLHPDSAWAGPVALELSGVLSAEGALPRDDAPRVRGSLELGPGSVNGGRLEGGRATLEMEDTRVVLRATIRSERGRLELDGDAELIRGEDGTGLASLVAGGNIELPDLDQFLGLEAPASLDGRIDVAGRRRPASDALDWRGSATAAGQLGGARLDALEVAGGIVDGVLRLDTLHVASNLMHGAGGGAVALDDSVASPPDGLRLLLELDSVSALADHSPIRPLSLRSGTLEVRATNPARGVRLEAIFNAGGLIASDFGADTLSGVATATLRGRSVAAGTARVRGSTLGWRAATLETVQADLAYDSAGGAQFAVGARRDETHELYTAGTAQLRDSTLRLDSLRISLPDDQWELAGPTTVQWEERFTVGGLALEAGPGRITIDGTLGRVGAQDLSVLLQEVRLDGFADLVGVESLEGMVDGRLEVSGQAANVAVDGNLVANLGSTRVDAIIGPAERGTAIELLLTNEDGGSLRIDGTLPLELSFAEAERDAFSGEAELDVTAAAFSLVWLTPFLEPLGVTELAGELDANARVEGPMSEPRMRGSAELAGGILRIPGQGVLYRDTRGDFELMGDRIAVRSLHMTAGGSAEVEGEIVLEPFANPRFDLTARLDEFEAARNRWTRLEMSGELTLTGDREEPHLGGTVSLLDTDIFADPIGEGENGGPVQLTEEDYAMLETYFGYELSESASIETDPILDWTMDLVVTLDRDVWLRKGTQPELRLELEGSVDVAKEAGDAIQLFGTIEVLPERSYFQEFGRRFDVTDGTVTFNGSIWDWEADVQAQYPVESFRDPSAPEVTITLAVTGGMDDLDVTMGSDPALETADILSYIATGRPAQSVGQFGGPGGGGNGVVGLGTSLALNRAVGALEDVAAESAGLDVIEIRQRGLDGTVLVAGRYVSSRLFVGFQQPLTVGSHRDPALGRTVPGTEVELEYSAYSWLLMSLRGGESTVSFFLRTKRVF
jgi:translocation and assembly module TamB